MPEPLQSSLSVWSFQTTMHLLIYWSWDLIFIWLATTPTLVWEKLIVHFTNVVMLSSKMITRKKPMDLLPNTPDEYKYLETPAYTTIVPARQKQFVQKNIIDNAPVHWITMPKNANAAFTGSYTKNPSCYRDIDLRQSRIYSEVVNQSSTSMLLKIVASTLRQKNNEFSRWFSLKFYG